MASRKVITVWRGKANLYPAISTYTTRLDLTGSWRYMKPSYRNLTAPCDHGCPAGNDVRGYIEYALKEKYDEAFKLILETSPFPSVCGRVCYHPCETECNRGSFDEPIAIHSLERFIGDRAKNYELPKPEVKVDKKVAVIGSGPAGLSCAYHLARKGYAVTVYESKAHPGGMLYYGIPAYRLPKDVLAWEIARIEQMGVKLILNTNVDNEAFREIKKYFDAVFIGLGAWGEQKMSVEGEDLAGVTAGLQLLNNINAGEQVRVFPKIMVVGGGNTAIDVARSVKRMGSHPLILYRRTEKEMPAHPDEIAEARHEGIDIHFLAAPKRIIGEAGNVVAVECQQMKLGPPDSSGRRRPVPIEGDTFTLEMDQVITAIGERPVLDSIGDMVKLKWNRIDRDKDGQTSLKGIYCGGDVAVNTAGTVTNAIGEGRRAAFAIEAYLFDQPSSFPANHPPVVNYDMLNVDYFSPAPRVMPPHLALSDRSDYREVVHALDQDAVVKEAERCFSCGVCNYCLNCITYCPDSSISMINECLEIDYKYCKGCGICVTECPRNAMCLEEER
ncbi:NAD(P)-binding protein [candidate division CSSED10-310 bacterium]|uniref:NAD(P)-binding protein n=1 Tax=candidate division CSSED10-310 bacterium TaxID=2855610 RepID=A0ABV6YV49_UNCC1